MHIPPPSHRLEFSGFNNTKKFGGWGGSLFLDECPPPLTFKNVTTCLNWSVGDCVKYQDQLHRRQLFPKIIADP